MKSTSLAVTCICLGTATAAAIQQQQIGEQPKPRVVSMDMARSNSISPLERHRITRRGTVAATLDNLDTLYFVNATLGTPEQSLRLHLDTGSSDLWVNTPLSSLCSQEGDPCDISGTYTANSSSTYNYLGSYFEISYIDGSGAVGDYVTDTFTIGDTCVSDFQFGIGYSSTASQGILGIGYPVNEVQVGRAKMHPYDNLPARLKSEGLTQTAAYSLYLNDLDASTGSILFGGVDTEQYEGTLWTLPVQADRGLYAEILITLTGLSLGSATLGKDMALAVLLDSGSSLTYLPDDMVSQAYSMTNATYDEQNAVAFVPCSVAHQTAILNFTFSGPSIQVALEELVLDLFDSDGRRLAFSNGVDACLFGLAPSGGGTNVLGDTFLRSAYLVYDLDNNEISIAQSSFNATQRNVVEITSSGVPLAVAVENPVKATEGITISTNESAGTHLIPPKSWAATLASLAALAALLALRIDFDVLHG